MLQEGCAPRTGHIAEPSPLLRSEIWIARATKRGRCEARFQGRRAAGETWRVEAGAASWHLGQPGLAHCRHWDNRICRRAGDVAADLTSLTCQRFKAMPLGRKFAKCHHLVYPYSCRPAIKTCTSIHLVAQSVDNSLSNASRFFGWAHRIIERSNFQAIHCECSNLGSVMKIANRCVNNSDTLDVL
jgi:hypothetical protein